MKYALPLVVLLCVAACGGKEAASDEPNDPAAAWLATIAYEAGVKLGGCTVGDLDPRAPGNEIAAVAVDGRVFLLSHVEGEWKSEMITRAPGEMIACAIGDADPAHDGNELVVVGMKKGGEDEPGAGQAHLVRFKEGDVWQSTPIAEDTALIHGVCIGDVDPEHEGNEIVTVGYSRKARVLAPKAGGWSPVGEVDLGSPGKSVVALEGSAVVACAGGSVTHIERKDGTWQGEALDLRTSGPARVGAHGKRLLVACNDGSLQLVELGTIQKIHQETAKLRGAVLADIDPVVDGVEAATAGYGKVLTLLYPPTAPGGKWTPVILWRDADRFHHLAAGELLEEGLGLELVAVGFSGRVIVAARTRR